MKDISVIIASSNEYPMNLFTALDLYEELNGYYDFEIVLVSNRTTDPHDHTRDVFDGCPSYIKNRIKFLEYNDNQSQWLAKNHGIKNSTGRLIFSIDAHCKISNGGLRGMIKFLNSFDGPIGGVHMRLRWTWLFEGKPVEWKIDTKDFNHKNTPAQIKDEPYEVATAGTCGMLCRREMFEELGYWQKDMAAYYSGEAYLIWRHGICGYPHYMHHLSYLWHPSMRKHNYPITCENLVRNRYITSYVLGGEKWLNQQYEYTQKKPCVEKVDFDAVKKFVLDNCQEDREFLQSKQIMTIDDYFKKWGINGNC